MDGAAVFLEACGEICEGEEVRKCSGKEESDNEDNVTGEVWKQRAKEVQETCDSIVRADVSSLVCSTAAPLGDLLQPFFSSTQT